jgi:alpha-beta hydrolase superfamily lysophospholipase
MRSHGRLFRSDEASAARYLQYYAGPAALSGAAGSGLDFAPPPAFIAGISSGAALATAGGVGVDLSLAGTSVNASGASGGTAMPSEAPIPAASALAVLPGRISAGPRPVPHPTPSTTGPALSITTSTMSRDPSSKGTRRRRRCRWAPTFTMPPLW